MAFVLLSGGGCLRPKPGWEVVPAGVRAEPGVFRDIGPRWSHDGKRIAFLRATPDRQLQLYVVDEALERPLAQLEAAVVTPDRPFASSLRRYAGPDCLAWSPDDRNIAFPRLEWFEFQDGERLPGTGLWTLDTYSGRVLPLALHPPRYKSIFYYYRTPQWSPDGRYVAFVGEGINGQRAVFIRLLAGQSAQEVVPRFDNYADSDWPTWEPRPAVRGAPHLLFRQGIPRPMTVPTTETLRCLRPGSPEVTTGERWRLTSAQYRHGKPSGEPGRTITPRLGHLAWSPDGKWIAFTLTPDPNDYARYELWVVRRDGRAARRVCPSEGRGYLAPVWIDSRRLGALSPAAKGFTVVTIDLIQGKKRDLGTIPSADCDWSPDRRSIVYADPADSTIRKDAPTTLHLFSTGL